MVVSDAPYINKDISRGFPLGLVVILSIFFHVFCIIGLPFLAHVLWQTKKFDRPKTFQLVSLPVPPNVPKRARVPDNVQKQRVARNEPAPSNVPGSQTKNNKQKTPSSGEAAQNQDALDELSNLLDEIPAPAIVSAVGDFKYPWYLVNVQSKIQKYWNPPTEKKNLKVVVAFTIFSDGSISNPEITKSSGDRSIDNLALRAVSIAAPFGKLSAGFNANRLDLNVTLIPTRK